MKHLWVAGLSFLLLSGCFEHEKRYRGDYGTSFVDEHPSIDIYAEFREPSEGGVLINGNTKFHFEWVRFGDLVSRGDGSKADAAELILIKQFLRETVGMVHIDPQKENDLYRIFFPFGSRSVRLQSDGHYFSSYEGVEPMDKPVGFYVVGDSGCQDQLTWDLEGVINWGNIVMKVDLVRKFLVPNVEPQEETALCQSAFQTALTENDFNPIEPDFSKIKSLYQLWYLILRAQIPDVDPIVAYSNLKELRISIVVAGVRKFKARWND